MKTFYVNGTILTMEEENLYAEAVCVENGRIIQKAYNKICRENLLALVGE